MMRRRAKLSDAAFPAMAGQGSVRGSPAGAAGMLAILMALSLGGCSSDVWSKFTAARASSDSEKTPR